MGPGLQVIQAQGPGVVCSSGAGAATNTGPRGLGVSITRACDLAYKALAFHYKACIIPNIACISCLNGQE